MNKKRNKMGNRKKNRITGVLRGVRVRFGCLLLWCAVLWSAGCTKDPGEGPGGETPPAGGTVMAEVTLTPEFMQQIAVKSVDGTDENIVKDVWVIQLNSDGTAQLQDPQYIASVSGSGGSYKLSAQFVLQASRVCFIANTHNNALFTSANATTAEQVEAATLAVASEAGLASADGIPMSGEWSGTPDLMSGISGDVSLTRAVAKVALNLSAALPAGHTFTLKSIKVKKVPKVVHYFRSDPSSTPHPAAGVAWFDDYASETCDEALTSTAKNLWWYLPENMRGTGTAADQKDKTAATAPSGQGAYCTCIEVSGMYSLGAHLDGTGVASYDAVYRIFLGEDNTKDYNLKRNTHYTVTTTIKGVNTADTRIDVDDPSLDYTDNGAPWFYAAPNDASGTMNWSAALSKCPSGWHLPSQQELMLMWVYKGGLGSFFASSYYWSATEDSGTSDAAWGVSFYTGFTDSSNKSGVYSVRCVRGVN